MKNRHNEHSKHEVSAYEPTLEEAAINAEWEAHWRRTEANNAL